MIHFNARVQSANVLAIPHSSLSALKCESISRFFRAQVLRLKETEYWTPAEKRTVKDFEQWLAACRGTSSLVNPPKEGSFVYSNLNTDESYVFLIDYGYGEYSLTPMMFLD